MDDESSLGDVGAKLAFARVSFNYFIGEAVFQYILAAVHLLASHAWKLLALYEFDPASGDRPTPSLADAAVPRMTCEPEHALARHLDEARQIVRAIEASWPRASMPDLVVSPEFERFPLVRHPRRGACPAPR